MSQKNSTFKNIMGLMLFLGIIIGIIYLTYNYWSSILNFIENMIFYTCVVLAGAALSYGLYYYTRKWFLGQLSKNENSVALAILAFIIYGTLLYWLNELIKPYSSEIDAGFIYFYKILFSFLILYFLLMCLLFIIGIKIGKKLFSAIILLSSISIVLIQYFFEDNVIYFLKNYWYLIVPIYMLIAFWGISKENDDLLSN